MKVHVEGRGAVTLRKSDFVAAGAYGRVWAIDDTAIKIWDDPRAAPPPDKLTALTALADPRVVVPRVLVRDEARGRVIGYTMRHVVDAWAWAQLVPSAFWTRHGLQTRDALDLVRELAEAIAAVHAAGMAIVDLSDTNVLVEPGSLRPALIDADSWQTPGHPATAVTPGFADPRARGFGPDSDWFSFAVLAFSLLVGLHPYKGKHPHVHGLTARMQAGISALDPAVRRPAACRSPRSIPAPWRTWFRRVFDHTHRGPPPPLPAAAPRPSPRRGTRQHVRSGDALTATFDALDGRVTLASLGGDPVFPATLPVPARGVVVVGATIFVLSHDKVLAVDPCRLGARIVVGLRPVADVMPHASQLWPGVVVQDILGVPHVTLLSPRGAITRRFDALAGHVVVDARHGDDRLELHVRSRDGTTERWVVPTGAHTGHGALVRAR